MSRIDMELPIEIKETPIGDENRLTCSLSDEYFCSIEIKETPIGDENRVHCLILFCYLLIEIKETPIGDENYLSYVPLILSSVD